MIYGLYQSAGGMLVNEYRQGVIANNLANAETVGFQRDVAVFAERLPAHDTREGPRQESLDGLSGGTWLGRTHTVFAEGNVTNTGNALDLAIDGPGFFVVQGSQGSLLTRDGRMMLAPDGTLVAAVDGAAVLGEGGGVIRLNPNGGAPMLTEDGWVRQDGAPVARLAVVDVSDERALSRRGAGRYAATQTVAAPNGTRVLSGFLEGSGVRPVTELVSMIETTRAYQMNAQMLTLQDQTAGRLIGLIANA